MEQTYTKIDQYILKLSKELPCCIAKYEDEIIICPDCKEWSGALDPCCGSIDLDLCEYCEEKLGY